YAAIRTPGTDPAAQLAKWEEFSAKWPKLAADPYMTGARLKLLVAAKRYAEARTLAEAVVTKAAKRNDLSALGTVTDAVSAATGEPDLAAVGVKAAEAALAIDGETAATLTRVTKAYAAAGDAA